MGNIEAVNLGDVGRAYVREHLADTNAFCTALLQLVSAESGETFTLAPIGTPQARLAQFDQGGLLPENMTRNGAVSLPDGSTLVPVASLREPQARLLRETVIAVDGACIVDDFNPRWSDGSPDRGPNAFGVGEEVYHLLAATMGENEFVAALACSNEIWHGVAAVCREKLHLDSQRKATSLELERVAASAVLITCTAYDGEGFVAWRR